MHASTAITDVGCNKCDEASKARYICTLAYDSSGIPSRLHKYKIQDPPCSLSIVLYLKKDKREEVFL